MPLSGQRTPDVPLDGVQLGALFGCGEARGVAAGSRTRGTAHPMDVVLDGVRHVVVDHALNVGDVDPTCRDVGSDQDAVAATAKALECLAPLRL